MQKFLDENALIAVVKPSFVMSSVIVLTKKRKKTLVKVKLIFREEKELRSKRPAAIPSISLRYTSSKSKSIDNTRFFYLKLQMHFDI